MELSAATSWTPRSRRSRLERSWPRWSSTWVARRSSRRLRSAERLGLKEGDSVTVVIKATEVMLARTWSAQTMRSRSGSRPPSLRRHEPRVRPRVSGLTSSLPARVRPNASTRPTTPSSAPAGRRGALPPRHREARAPVERGAAVGGVSPPRPPASRGGGPPPPPVGSGLGSLGGLLFPLTRILVPGGPPPGGGSSLCPRWGCAPRAGVVPGPPPGPGSCLLSLGGFAPGMGPPGFEPGTNGL